jgi:RNA polymerase sigma factor (sigma-70 family)
MNKSFLKECIAGHSKAQQELYDLYAPKMYAICYRYAVDSHMAEEMMQEGFIKIYQNLSKFEQKGSFDGWMHRIMVNTSLEFLRKEKKGHQQLSIDNHRLEQQTSSNTIDDMSVKEIMSAIRSLPESYRNVINLYIIDGYSHKEIAVMLDISEDNSKQRLKRGRTMLQEILVAMQHIPDEKFQ